MGVIRLSFELLFITISLAIVVAFIPTNVWFADFPLEPRSYELPGDSTVVDENGKNTVRISKAKPLLNALIPGPESMVINGSFIYTGIADGRIVLIDKKSLKYQTVTRIGDGSKCGNDGEFVFWRPEECGRPLGLRLHPKSGNLIVIDPYFGIFEIIASKRTKKLIVFGENDKRPNEIRGMLNDAVFDPEDDNILYVTVSTTRWGIRNFAWSLVEHENSGKVFAVNLSTKKITKIVDNLYGANGLEVTPDKKRLLICETYTGRIYQVKLYQVRNLLKSGTGSVEPKLFADNLPGGGDNIRLINGDIYAAIVLPNFGRPSVMDRLSNIPIIRKAIGRSLYLMFQIVKLIRTSVYDHQSLEVFEYLLSSGAVLMPSPAKSGVVVVLDGNNGHVKQTLIFDGIPSISEIAIDEDTGDLYLGSISSLFLGKLNKNDFTSLI